MYLKELWHFQNIQSAAIGCPSAEVGSSSMERERFVFCSTGGAMAGRGLRWLLRLSNSATISTAGPAGFASRCSSKCIQQEVQLLDVFGAAGFRGRAGSLPLAGQFSHLMTLPNVVSKECTVRRQYYPVCNIGRDLYLEACDLMKGDWTVHLYVDVRAFCFHKFC